MIFEILPHNNNFFNNKKYFLLAYFQILIVLKKYIKNQMFVNFKNNESFL